MVEIIVRYVLYLLLAGSERDLRKAEVKGVLTDGGAVL